MIKKIGWVDFKTLCLNASLNMLMEDKPSVYVLTAINGVIVYRCDIEKFDLKSAEQLEFESLYKSNCNKRVTRNEAFAEKNLANGKKLFRRKHGYTLTLAASGTTTYTITVPYVTAKINEAEILWAPEGVSLNMKVKDSATGTFSGVPNYVLNQFGFNVVLSKDFYSDYSQYDADVYGSMQIEFTFTNNSGIEKQIGINLVFHEIL